MILLQKSYRKIYILFLCVFLGLSMGTKKTYAVAARLTKIIARNAAPRYAARYASSIGFAGPGWFRRGSYLAGYADGRHKAGKLIGPYPSYRAFITQSMQTVPSLKSTLEALHSSTNGEALLELLQQIACLDAAPIPVSFVLLALGKEDEEAQAGDMLATLEKKGLIIRQEQTIYMQELTKTVIDDLYPLTAAQVKNLVNRYVDHSIDKVAAASYPIENFYNEMILHGEKLLTLVQTREEDDDSAAQCYNKLSNLYFAQGNKEKALACGKKACILFEHLHGKGTSHLDLAFAYNNLGNVYYHQKMYGKALECYQAAHTIFEEASEDTLHSHLAFSYNNLGNIYYQQKMYDKTLYYYEKALGVFKALYGEKPHLGIVFAYNNLGTVYYLQNLYDEAINFYEKSLNMYKEMHADSPHQITAATYKGMYLAYEDKGDVDNANTFYEKWKAIEGEV